MLFSTLSRLASSLLSASSLWSGLGSAAPTSMDLAKKDASDRLVFAHFMIGIVSDRTGPQDYDDDIKRAQSMGIDAFALNIGVDPYTDQQLQYAYQSAESNGFKVFISFDFNWWHTNQATEVGQKVAQYASSSAQLKVDNKAFVSSFAGDGLDVAAMRSAAGQDLFFVPNFHPGQGDFSAIDGALNWLGWPNNGNNKAPDGSGNVSVEDGDNTYKAALGDKAYLAPVSGAFFCHFGPSVSYSKNWVFPSNDLWFNRWNEILTLGPRFIEIVTWNDYGESHYVGPLNSKHTDDGASQWVNDMPHDGWLDMAKPFIAAYKAGETSVDSQITDDQLVYWYRPQPGTSDCDATDTTMQPANNDSGNYFMGRPYGAETMRESVFVTALLKRAGTVVVNSGSNSKTFDAPAGASIFEVPMGVGKQSFALQRDSQMVIGSTSLKDIIDGCVCGIYNYNYYVGTVPDGKPFPDQLGPDGLASLTVGLQVSTCSATPSLGTQTLPYSGPTGQAAMKPAPASNPQPKVTSKP